MKRETLLKLDESQLAAYASILGVDVSSIKTAKAKVNAIEKARERVASIDVFGTTIEIPIKRLHDLNITKKLDGGNKSDAEVLNVMREILGDDQMQVVYDLCTDDDGTIDAEAVSLALFTIANSDELKNF